MAGAVCLAAKAAFKVGAGIVTACVPNEIYDIVEKTVVSAMTYPVDFVNEQDKIIEKMQGYDVTNKADISSFADTADVSDWALDAIRWANKTELVNGTSETTLSPKATATRAQVAAILMRFCENIAK